MIHRKRPSTRKLKCRIRTNDTQSCQVTSKNKKVLWQEIKFRVVNFRRNVSLRAFNFAISFFEITKIAIISPGKISNNKIYYCNIVFRKLNKALSYH